MRIAQCLGDLKKIKIKKKNYDYIFKESYKYVICKCKKNPLNFCSFKKKLFFSFCFVLKNNQPLSEARIPTVTVRRTQKIGDRRKQADYVCVN